MDVEKEARQRALEHVAKLVRRPDQLDRIGELKKQEERKKAVVEAKLGAGVQSQLEGIRTAIAQLRSAADDVVAVETETTAIRASLKPFPALQEKMKPLRELSERHDQYGAALDNLRLIVEIHELIAASKTALTEGQLLLVHKNIMDLERARDELMYEVHKVGGPTMEKDKKALLMLFRDVDELVNLLWKECGAFLKRCLAMKYDAEHKEGATTLVSVLRIIEREERIDKYFEDRSSSMKDFIPPGRPRRWRETAIGIIDNAVWNRVNMSQIEDDRSMSAAWLARYLECTRMHMVQDLCMAKSLSATCFPPHYEMYDRFVGMYHSSVQRKLREIIEADSNLNKLEIVQLLKWIKEYTNEELLGDQRLNLNPQAIVAEDPLLPPDVIVQLREKFLEITRDDMTGWLERALDKVKDDWNKHVLPEKDEDGNYYSPLHCDLFGMIEGTLTLAKEFPMDASPHVIDMAMQQFQPFIIKYRDAAMAFRAEHYKDRTKFPQFTKTMIAAANSMMSSAELTDKYLRQIRLSMEEENGGGRGGMRRHDIIDHITKAVDAWYRGTTSITSVLFEEVILDLSKHLEAVFSREWLDGTADPMRVIVATLQEYHEDHSHLKSAILLYLAQRVHLRVVGEYLRAIESRRLTFGSLSERQKAAELLKENAEGIEFIFKNYVPKEEQAQFTPLQTILVSIADVLAVTDKSCIEIDMLAFARRFPNCPVDVLAALLMAREDLGRAEAKEMAESCLSHTADHPRDAAFGELFESARADAPSWVMAAAGTRMVATSMLASMFK